ncbi:PUR family DNA/RNA-binding protein [Bacteroidales bacterium OttesenSCG-928-M06]|nr:PUR family DNA/RNA-binding protein [Bacteroidales bacterium OttesenSCG-928-M06]
MDTNANIKSEKNEALENDILFSRTINAGKRIYYLDVKQNRKGELFLVMTESKKIIREDDMHPVFFEKHKIFLYKEDFDKFTNAVTDAINYIKENNEIDFVP